MHEESDQPVGPREPDPPPSPWVSWGKGRLLGLAVLLIVGNFTWQAIAYLAGGGLFLPVLVGAVAGVILPLALLVRQAQWRPTRDLCLDRPHPLVLLGAALLAVAALAPTSLLAQLSLRLHPADPEWATFLQDNLPTGPWQLALTVVAVVIVAPLAEELIFRGLIHRLAASLWGSAAAIAISSLIFGLIHGEPWFLLGLVGVGAMLAVVFETTRSVTACWLAHAVHNGVSVALMVSSGEALGEPAAPTTSDLALTAASLVVFFLLVRLLQRASPARRS